MFDEFAILMAVLTAVAWVFIGIFQAAKVGTNKEKPFSWIWYVLSLAAMMVMIFADHAFVFVGGYGALLVFGTLMLRKHRAEGEKSLWTGYLVNGLIGLAFIIGGLFVVSPMLSSYYFLAGGNANLDNKEMFAYGTFAIMLGFFAASGVAPFIWLKSMNEKASGAMNALFSSAMLGAGFIGSTRFLYFLLGTEGIEIETIQFIWGAIAVLAMLLSAVLACKEKNVAKKLGYVASAQMAIILFGFTTLTGNAFIGSALLFVGFVVAMIVMFMSVAALQEKMNIQTVADFAGAGKKYPVVMWCFTISLLYLTGIAPFGGFIGRWYLIRGAFFEGITFLQLQWVGPVVVILASLLIFAAVLPMLMKAFFMEAQESADEGVSKPEENETSEEDDEESVVKMGLPKAIVIPVVILTVLLVVYSVWPMQVYNVLQTIAEKMLA